MKSFVFHLIVVLLLHAVCVYSQGSVCFRDSFQAFVEHLEYDSTSDSITYSDVNVYFKDNGLYYRVDYQQLIPSNETNTTLILNYQAGVEYYIDYVEGNCNKYALGPLSPICFNATAIGTNYFIGASTDIAVLLRETNEIYAEYHVGTGSDIPLRELAAFFNLTGGIELVVEDIYLNWDYTEIDLSVFTPPADLCTGVEKSELKTRNEEILLKPRLPSFFPRR